MPRIETFQPSEVTADLTATLDDDIVERLVTRNVHVAVMPELVVGLPIPNALQRVLREKGDGDLRGH
jgi:hypothetical protein